MKIELLQAGETIPGSKTGQQWSIRHLKAIKKFSTRNVPVFFKPAEGEASLIGQTKSLLMEKGVLSFTGEFPLPPTSPNFEYRWLLSTGRFGSLRAIVFAEHEKGKEVE